MWRPPFRVVTGQRAAPAAAAAAVAGFANWFWNPGLDFWNLVYGFGILFWNPGSWFWNPGFGIWQFWKLVLESQNWFWKLVLESLPYQGTPPGPFVRGRRRRGQPLLNDYISLYYLTFCLYVRSLHRCPDDTLRVQNGKVGGSGVSL